MNLRHLLNLNQAETREDNLSLRLFTDGACFPNPGPGGWAWRAVGNGVQLCEQAAGQAHSTNNRMEIMACMMAMTWARDWLTTLEPSRRVVIRVVSDSQYVTKGHTEWAPAWRSQGWAKRQGGTIENLDLWRQSMEVLDQINALYLQQGRPGNIGFEWVRGHTGNPHNEAVDRLAVAARKTVEVKKLSESGERVRAAFQEFARHAKNHGNARIIHHMNEIKSLLEEEEHGQILSGPGEGSPVEFSKFFGENQSHDSGGER